MSIYGRPRTRQRASNLAKFSSLYQNSSGSASSADYYWKDYEITHDSLHPQWFTDNNLRVRTGMWHRFFTDEGGPFHSDKVRVSKPNLVSLHGYSVLRSNWTRFNGPLWASAEVNTAGQFNVSDRNPLSLHSSITNLPDLGPYGATAVSRVRPTDPAVSVAQTLGELKEGIPTPDDILRQKTLLQKTAAGNLSYQFAIKPLVSDLQAYRDAYDTSAKTVDQWRRDSGRRIRRRYRFPEEVTTTREVKTNVLPYGIAGSTMMRAGTLTKSTHQITNIWFSGAFRYYVPPVASDWHEKLQDYDRVYGVVPDLSTGWELLPFSWLVDWHSNAGDVVSNISAVGGDGCFLAYGYIMRHSRIEVTYEWRGPLSIGQSWTQSTLVDTIYHDRKERREAEPFAIGFSGDDLTNRQKGILASLGVMFAKR